MYNVTKNPQDFLKQIANRHKIIRKEKKLSQADLAERAGVSLGSLKRFEQTGQVSLESLLRTAHVLGCLNDFENLFKPKDNNDAISHLFSDDMR